MNYIGMLCFILSYLMAFLIVSFREKDRCLSFCHATAYFLFILFAITEGLSLFHKLDSTCVAVSWCVVAVVELALVLRNKKARMLRVKEWIAGLSFEKLRAVSGDGFLFFEILVLVYILIRSTWLSINTVPYNFDSMTYHLPRILFWAEHKTVAYYGTNILRQLISPVFAEYVNLHVFLLTGTDRLFNLLQNLSLYGCVFIVYQLVRSFGVDRKWSVLGCILTACTNIVYAESTTTQVDLFAALILLIVAYQIIVMFNQKVEINRRSLRSFLPLGICAGLLYITKSNAVVSAACLALVFFLLRLIRKDKIVSLILMSLIACIVALFIASPTFYRNYQETGDILASNYMGGITVGTFNPKMLFMNGLKNYSSVAVRRSNERPLSEMVINTGNIIRADVNAPEISYYGVGYSIGYSTSIDKAGAHVAAPLLALGFFLSLIRLITKRKLKYLIVFALAAQLVANLMIVRWQPWVSRLLVPCICLAIPVPVILLGELFPFGIGESHPVFQGKRSLVGFMALATIVFLCICSNSEEHASLLNYAMTNVDNLSSKFDLYFQGRFIGDIYKGLNEYLNENECKRLGIYTGEDSYQYPILARWYNIMDIENVTMYEMLKGPDKSMNPSFDPDVIFVADIDLNESRVYMCNGNTYLCDQTISPGFTVWRKMKK